MGTSKALLKAVAKAFVKYAGNAVGLGFAGDLLVDVAPEIVGDIWDSWAKSKSEAQRRSELESILQASNAELRQQIVEVVAEVAGRESPQVQQATAEYLVQVPAAMRQSLRRCDDARGSTIPAKLVLDRAESLLPLLPARLPRFKVGDRPLSGVDCELEELLGVGGFGEVWKARNPNFDGIAPVALKFCLEPAEKERLLRHEAAILNRVMREGKHPGIVQLQQTYLNADPPCLAYEYIDGGDLAGLVQTWPAGQTGATLNRAHRIMLRLSEIVGFAHRLNPPIVHRDLKPANVLVQTSAEGPQFKIADFGIGGLAARRTNEEASFSAGQTSLRAAALHGSGTPMYASPQQLRGEPPDPRDDVYALGVIWHQLLTGDFTSGRPGGSRWRQKLQDQGLSQQLLMLVEASFEDDAADRPQDAAVLAEQLRKLLSGEMPSQASFPAAASRSTAPNSGPLNAAPAKPAIERGDEVRCFAGHSQAVVSLAFLPSGDRLVSGSRDHTVRLWDVASGQQLGDFQGHTDAVYCLAVSPQGDRMLSGSKDRTIRLWDVPARRELRQFSGHTDTVYGVVVLPDGKSAASCSGDATLRRWNLANGRMEQSFTGQGDRIYCLALSPKGDRVLYGCEDHAVRVWDLGSGKVVKVLEGHAAAILSVACAADGRHALSGSMDKTVRLWDLKTGRELACLEPGVGAVSAVAISPDGKHALCGGVDRTVRLCLLKTGQEVHRFEGHAGQVAQIAFSPHGKFAASGSHDTTVRLWELPN